MKTAKNTVYWVASFFKEDPYITLKRALKEGNTKEVKRLIKEVNLDVKHWYEQGSIGLSAVGTFDANVLYYACTDLNIKFEIIKYLLSKGAKDHIHSRTGHFHLSAPPNEANSPLEFALDNPKVTTAIIQLFLDNGATIDYRHLTYFEFMREHIERYVQTHRELTLEKKPIQTNQRYIKFAIREVINKILIHGKQDIKNSLLYQLYQRKNNIHLQKALERALNIEPDTIDLENGFYNLIKDIIGLPQYKEMFFERDTERLLPEIISKLDQYTKEEKFIKKDLPERTGFLLEQAGSQGYTGLLKIKLQNKDLTLIKGL